MRRSGTVLATVAIVAFAWAVLGNWLALPGYLRFLERGGTSAAGNAFDLELLVGAVKTVSWMYAFAVGALCLYWRALQRSHPGWLRAGVALGVLWLLFWSIPELPRAGPAFYATLGGAVLVAIVAVHLARPPVSGPAAGFLSATAVLFFALATWEVCGLGSSGRILHPELVVLDRSQTLLSTQTIKLIVAFLLAWSALAASGAASLGAHAAGSR